jgi:hypothetical protein
MKEEGGGEVCVPQTVREYQLLLSPNELWHVMVDEGRNIMQLVPTQSSAILHTPQSLHSHTQHPRFPVGRSTQHSQSLPSSCTTCCAAWSDDEEEELVVAVVVVAVAVAEGRAGMSSSESNDGAREADEASIAGGAVRNGLCCEHTIHCTRHTRPEHIPTSLGSGTGRLHGVVIQLDAHLSLRFLLLLKGRRGALLAVHFIEPAPRHDVSLLRIIS